MSLESLRAGRCSLPFRKESLRSQSGLALVFGRAMAPRRSRGLLRHSTAERGSAGVGLCPLRAGTETVK